MKKLGFSWKRAVGLSSAKRKFSKFTGVPTTKSGRKNKMRRMATGGCLIWVLIAVMVFTAGCSGLVTWLEEAASEASFSSKSESSDTSVPESDNSKSDLSGESVTSVNSTMPNSNAVSSRYNAPVSANSKAASSYVSSALPSASLVSSATTKGKMIVYWGNTGDKIHIKPDCHTIKNGSLSGSHAEALEAGHTEGWCGVCSNGWTDARFFEEGNPYAN